MKIVKGDKIEDISKESLLNITQNYSKVTLDLGTGDGRFVYSQAQENSEHFFIGVDPSQDQLKIYSKKANRKKLKNAIFAIGSVEFLPNELIGLCDEVFILFPWGTLLKEVVSAHPNTLTSLKKLLKSEGKLEIIFGYHPEKEPSETERLDLAMMDETFIKETLIPQYQSQGFELVGFENLIIENLKKIDSSWGKRLSFGTERPFFRAVFKIQQAIL